MPSLRLKIQYNKNEGILISPTELRESYLFGIPTCTSDGRKMSEQAMKQHILTAQESVEKLFSIKLEKQAIYESRDFVREEFNAWGYVRSMYPIVYIDYLKGYINDACQVDYPKEWLSIKKIAAVAVYRNVYLIPNSASSHGATMSQNSIIYNGLSPHLGWFGQKWIPNYWRLLYTTGWNAKDIPTDLLDFIAKLAALNVLAVIGDFLYGVGLTSINISLDGVSQTTPLSRGGKYGLFGARIQLYLDEMNRVFGNLKNIYRGITFEVL